LKAVSPELTWDWPHLAYTRKHLADITRGTCDRLAIAWPPQHCKTWSTTVRYPLWRMLRAPGLRVVVVTHTQDYADQVSHWTRQLAARAGVAMGAVRRAHQWELANGSTYLARGVGGSISGRPADLAVLDDPFGSREDADSPRMQEKVYNYYMDDLTPRLQKGAAIVIIHTRWNPGDLIGRILESEEGPEWRYIRLPAIAEENDPLGRKPGEPLCEDRFPLGKLEQKRRTEGVGFESLYQQNPIPRGGTFFARSWFGQPVEPAAVPADTVWVRYWDLANSRADSACYTAAPLVGKSGSGESTRFWFGDVVRGRWTPADRNDVMLQTARGDAARPGFQKTWFEKPVFDKDGAASRAIVAKLAGYPVSPDNVGGQGSKELRAEPLAGAAKAGLVRLVAGAWNAAFLTEYEGFPRGQWKDQVDSGSGAFNKLSRPAGGASLNGKRV
jgi:predicted phage terminase large subunit-like protein